MAKPHLFLLRHLQYDRESLEDETPCFQMRLNYQEMAYNVCISQCCFSSKQEIRCAPKSLETIIKKPKNVLLQRIFSSEMHDDPIQDREKGNSVENVVDKIITLHVCFRALDKKNTITGSK